MSRKEKAAHQAKMNALRAEAQTHVERGTWPDGSYNCPAVSGRESDFYRPIERIRTFKSKHSETRDRGVRLYCTQWKKSWCLQVRAPMSLGSSGYGPDGKDFVIAGASLDLDDMRAIRDALSAFIAESEAG